MTSTATVSDSKKRLRPDTSDLIKSRIHGATPAFAGGQAGARVADRRLVKMRIHGVAEIHQDDEDLGYKICNRQAGGLRITASPDFIRG